MNLKFILFLLIFSLFINKIKSVQLIFEIDLNSNISYINNECGGSHDIVLNGSSEFWYQDNTIKFPPCRSISDAGFRARQFYYRPIVYNNVSHVLEFINFDWKNIVIIDNTRYGDLKKYCGFEIRVKDEPDAIITIDGSRVGYKFLDYYGYSENQTTCDPNYPTRIRLKNIKFINFFRNIIINAYNHNVALQTIQMEFSSITVVNSNVFLVSNPYYEIEQTILKLENCSFSNVISTFGTTILYFNNRAIINNCVFKNISLDFPLVISEEGGLTISNVLFESIKLTNNAQVITASNKPVYANNIIVSNCEISPFLTFRVYKIPIDSSFIFNNKISNIQFKNNNTLYTSLKTSSYSKYNSLFNLGFETNDYPGRYIQLDLSNISFDSSNGNGSTEKQFLYTNLVNDIKIENVIVPNIFSNSIYATNTKFNISNTTFFHSSPTFCIGSFNSFYFQVFKNQLSNNYINFIENSKTCDQCQYNYLFDEFNSGNSSSSDKNNSSNSNDSSNNSYNSIEHSNSGENKNSSNSASTINDENENKFNKVLIVPIVLSGLIIIMVLVSIIFRKRIKQFLKKFNSTNNNGGGEVEEIGGVPLENLN